MTVNELLEESVSAALERASALEHHLRDLGGKDARECHDEAHRLVADIVALRNAAELLKRDIAVA